MKRKLIASLLALVMVLSITTSTMAATDKLTIMGWEQSELEYQAIVDGLAKFKEQTGIEVEFTTGPDGADYVARLMAAITGDVMPDVFFIAAEEYRQFADRGIMVDLTDKFSDEYSFDDFLPSVQQIMDIDGHIYGIQSCIVAPVIYYNKDIFDELGVPYPDADPDNAWTAEEFREIAKQLTVKDENGEVVTYGVYGLETAWLMVYASMLSAGVAPYTDDYWTSTFASAETAEILQWIYDIRHVDGSALDALTLSSIGMSAAQMLQTGKVAMIVDGSWALQHLATMGFPVGKAPLPVFGEATTISFAHLHAISATSPNQDEAWELLKFLSGLDYQGELVSQGLWMPNRISMYAPDIVEQWYVEEVHGEDYLKMLDYFRDSAVGPTALQKTSKAEDILAEETQLFFEGEQTVEETMKNIDGRTNEALAEIKE